MKQKMESSNLRKRTIHKKQADTKEDNDDIPLPPPAHPPPANKSSMKQLIIVAFLSIIAAVVGFHGTKVVQSYLKVARVFSPGELAKYDGTNENNPVYLAILGQVYDVSGGEYYKEGNGYNFFAGIDGTRAFVSGVFEGDADDSVDGLTPAQLLDVVSWVHFYRDHEVYEYIGKVSGTYYDKNGKPTEKLKEVENSIKDAEEAKAKVDELMKLYPRCNSRWSQTEGGFVWCTADLLKGRAPESKLVPRIFTTGSTLQHHGDAERCACIEYHLDGTDDRFRLYDDCPKSSTRCVTSPPQEQKEAEADANETTSEEDLTKNVDEVAKSEQDVTGEDTKATKGTEDSTKMDDAITQEPVKQSDESVE